jgi:2-dehydropantoate 2-reductase
MKTAIIGAGAMGSLYGGLLAFSGQEVWLVDIWKEHIETIRSQGLMIEEKGQGKNARVHATTDVSSIGQADLVIFFVKTYHLEKAVSDALALEKESTLFLTLQNGLGNEEVLFKKVKPEKVLLGVTNHGATLLGPGKIRHAGWGKTFIGELDHRMTERIKEVARMFQKAELETEISADIQRLVWEKLLINIGINALAAVTRLKNGQLLDHPETLRLMDLMVAEAVEVARRKGISLAGNPLEKVKAVAEATKENRCSMGQDLDNKRRTEIDAINGAIVREAERMKISVPYNLMITHLVKVIERTHTLNSALQG